MAIRECYLPNMTLNGYFRRIAYNCETKTGRLDFGPHTVAYDKATCVWMVRAIDPRVRRVEVTAGCGDACYVLGEKGRWRTLKASARESLADMRRGVGSNDSVADAPEAT